MNPPSKRVASRGQISDLDLLKVRVDQLERILDMRIEQMERRMELFENLMLNHKSPIQQEQTNSDPVHDMLKQVLDKLNTVQMDRQSPQEQRYTSPTKESIVKEKQSTIANANANADANNGTLNSPLSFMRRRSVV